MIGFTAYTSLAPIPILRTHTCTALCASISAFFPQVISKCKTYYRQPIHLIPVSSSQFRLRFILISPTMYGSFPSMSISHLSPLPKLESPTHPRIAQLHTLIIRKNSQHFPFLYVCTYISAIYSYLKTYPFCRNSSPQYNFLRA